MFSRFNPTKCDHRHISNHHFRSKELKTKTLKIALENDASSLDLSIYVEEMETLEREIWRALGRIETGYVMYMDTARVRRGWETHSYGAILEHFSSRKKDPLRSGYASIASALNKTQKKRPFCLPWLFSPRPFVLGERERKRTSNKSNQAE